MFITGCSQSGEAYYQVPEPKPIPISTRPATPTECPTGGNVVEVGDQLVPVCTGATGASGVNGSNGSDGHDGINGQDGQNGADGSNGQNGSDGQDGAPGATGPQGPTGPAGSPGTQITVVTLCPGVTSYPGVFVEIALCMNNNLYGVYSANGGFLTYFPPGNYSSNGIGSSCNLTIQPNCIVSH